MRVLPVSLTAAFVILPAFAYAADIAAPSTWVNERGSVMTIDSVDASTGKMVGKFVNNAAGTSCLGDPGFDLGGQNETDSVRLFVTFKNQSEDCHSITLWQGTVENDTITTIWELVYLTPDGFSTTTGADVFKKQ